MTNTASETTARAATSDHSVARGLILINVASGSDATDVDELRAKFAEHDVEQCRPEDIESRVRDARKEGRPFVGIAGGDGSIRVAAEELAHSETALLPIPEGTLNHFARAVGIEQVDDAVAANATRTVDLGRVNDRGFVNNSSIGFYPGVVHKRESAAPSRLPKPVATLLAAYNEMRHGSDLTVEIDGRSVRAWLVFVGNNCYGESINDITSREIVDEHVLDVRIVRADQRFARLRLAAALLFGRLARTAVVERRTCRAITIDVRGNTPVDVALDGELVKLETPLRYESDPNALLVRY
jgi:diacylglycerol kinase family enzyme